MQCADPYFFSKGGGGPIDNFLFQWVRDLFSGILLYELINLNFSRGGGSFYYLLTVVLHTILYNANLKYKVSFVTSIDEMPTIAKACIHVQVCV